MPRCEIVALVPRPGRPEILVRAGGADRLTLPTTAIEGEFRTTAAVSAAEALLGPLPPVLRVGHRTSHSDGEPTFVAIELEAMGGEPPDGFAWAAWTRVLDAQNDGTAIRPALGAWIERQTTGPAPLEPPWAHPGWFARASAWMIARLDALGIGILAPPRLEYTWGISMVLRAPTSAGDVYLKATSPVFAREAVLTARLAEATPELVTPVLAIEPDEGWLLMSDLGGEPLGDLPDDRWEPGLEVYGQIQRAWSGRTLELATAGAETRALADLAEASRTLADHEPLADEFSPDERAAWIAAIPDLIRACERLDALGPAPTISHGDLHPWNVASTPAGPRIFDWSDAAIAHPFLDLAVYATRPKDVARRRALRAVYLEGWRTHLEPDALEEAGELAIVVGSLYQVESYRRILTGLVPDDRGGMQGAARSWALATLAALRDGIALRRVGHADG